jgi:peroxiredoxin Q/BCP
MIVKIYVLAYFQGWLIMGKEYDGIHRISFLINEQGTIEHVFDDFKTSNHHQILIDYLDSL